MTLAVHTGSPLLVPGLMSINMTVPAAVPSLFHSSLPWISVLAWKKRLPMRADMGAELLGI